MDLHKIAEQLNIADYPEELNDLSINPDTSRICDPAWIDHLEREYNVFGKYYPLIREAAIQLQNDNARLCWGQIIASYLEFCDVSHACQVPMPASDMTLAGNFLPLLILMTQLEHSVAEYRRRNMPEDMIKRNLYHYIDGIDIIKYESGHAAINKTYFNWLTKFAKAKLFNAHGFNFEIKALPSNICVLKDIKTSELIPVFTGGIFHRCGMSLGSAGFEGDSGCFCANFEESETTITGHACHNERADSHKSTFSKAEYDIFLRPGDPIVSVHIPRGTDISATNATQALKAGFQDAVLYYPEHAAKALWCQSWLLDPNLQTLLKHNSRIVQFGNLFTRYPVQSKGKEIFSFVYRKQMPLSDLPEKTSLEQALKQHYLNGKFIHAYAGVILPELL